MNLRARLSGIGVLLISLLYRRQPAHQVCPECAVGFVPALTDDHCPICGWRAPGTGLRPRTRLYRVRQATGLGMVWFLGLVAFALVAHALYS